MDENAGHLAGGGVGAHDDVGIAALLEVRIEDRFAGRAPARLQVPESRNRAQQPKDSLVNTHR